MRSLPLVLVALGVALPASADDAALRRCREIKESTARLACYDALPVGEARAAPAAPPASRREPAPVAPTPLPAPSAVAPPAARATAPAAAAPAAPVAGLESSFGMESRAPAAELPAIESHIPGAFLGWSQYTTIRMANGQVWQVVDEDSRRMRLQDPKVRVRRGMMGAFYLEFEAHNYAPRVRRLQ
jgi:hypothetical protein